MTAVTIRVNRFYIFTGASDLLQPASLDEIRATAKALRKRRHVNRLIVESYLDVPDADRTLTRIELRYLAEGDIGESMDKFLRRFGVSRRYEYEAPAREIPSGIVRRPAGAR